MEAIYEKEEEGFKRKFSISSLHYYSSSGSFVSIFSQVGSDDEYADIDWDAVGFSLTPTDYMYVMKCSQQEDRFTEGQLNPYGNIELSPAAGVLNYGQMIPVAANDVAFSSHAVLLTAFTLFQIFIYERKNQRFSKVAIGIVSAIWLAAAGCFFVALHQHSWFWLISVFNTIQVIMTVIKYVPQAIMNFRLKSTDGFSIGNILLDLLGGVTNYGQMAMQSIDQNSWVNFYGNIGKTLLSLVSIFFDILFIIQHYVLYPAKKRQQLPVRSPSLEEDNIK